MVNDGDYLFLPKENGLISFEHLGVDDYFTNSVISKSKDYVNQLISNDCLVLKMRYEICECFMEY